MTASETLSERWNAVMSNNYGTPSLALVRGQGARVWDADGVEYVDLLAGIAVNALGHAHPAVIEAVNAQLSTLGHTSNLAMHEPGIALAERLIELSGRPGRVFFCNSGAEANEAAFKLARLTGRRQIVAAQGSFHGRTMGALAMTGQVAKQTPFLPLPDGVVSVPYGDVGALDAITEDTAAVVLEPIQGEGGVIPAPVGYLAAAQQLCRDAGALLILDEVQTGIGRTGNWFAYQHEQLTPDAITLAKGLGGGLPIGALLVFGPAMDLWQPGHHGSTFGGNPVSAAASLAVLDTLESDGWLARVPQTSTELIRIFMDSPSHEGVPLISGVRGQGLLLGITLARPVAQKLERAARGHGLLVNAIGDSLIRVAPPLVLTDDDLSVVAQRWPAAVAGVLREEAIA